MGIIRRLSVKEYVEALDPCVYPGFLIIRFGNGHQIMLNSSPEGWVSQVAYWAIDNTIDDAEYVAYKPERPTLEPYNG